MDLKEKKPEQGVFIQSSKMFINIQLVSNIDVKTLNYESQLGIYLSLKTAAH